MPAPLLDIRPDHLKIVCDILQAHVPQYEAWAFGSRAKWTAKEYSDLDLCIVSDHALSFSLLGALADDFSESDLPYKVDIVDWATTGESFRKIIERDKVVVQKGGKCAVSPAPTLRKQGIVTRLLENCLDALIDYRGKTPEKTAAGIPLITAKIIKGGRIETPTEFIALENYDLWMHRGMPRAGDVVLTVEAPLGEVAQLGPEKVALAQRVVTLRGKDGVLDNGYLLYLLQTDEMQSRLKARATGTTVLGIKQSELRKVLLDLPPIDIQVEAVATLKVLDERITLLRETNATLEAIAQALFKSWFVDFDPVRAKQAGCTSESMDEATAALFPDSFEESELGLVPKGWGPQRLESFIELAYGKALKATDRLSGDIPVYGSGGVTGFHNKSLVDGPSVIVGRKGTVGSLYWEDLPFFPIDTVFYVRSSVPMTYCYYLLQTLGLSDMNTDAAVPGLNRNNVYRLLVSLPAFVLLEAFDEVVNVFRNRIFKNNQQAQTLATLRDTLLPRLISGLLRVPDVDNRCSREEISS